MKSGDEYRYPEHVGPGGVCPRSITTTGLVGTRSDNGSTTSAIVGAASNTPNRVHWHQDTVNANTNWTAVSNGIYDIGYRGINGCANDSTQATNVVAAGPTATCSDYPHAYSSSDSTATGGYDDSNTGGAMTHHYGYQQWKQVPQEGGTEPLVSDDACVARMFFWNTGTSYNESDIYARIGKEDASGLTGA